MRYTITHIPNDDQHKTLMSIAMPEGATQRRRGRGYRHARWPGDVQYHQSLPLELAGYFTQYVEAGDYSWHTRPHSDYLRGQFIGIDTRTGKPRIKVLLSRIDEDVEEERMFANCDDCGTSASPDDIGTTCRTCGRGMIE